MLLGHVAEALEAERTLVLVPGEFFETLLVHGVPTVQED